MSVTSLPEVKIVRHASAKSLRLRVYPHEVRLTVPKFCSQKQIEQFLIQSQEWLLKTWQKVAQPQSTEFPSQIQLFGLNEAAAIECVEQKALFRFDEPTHTLFLSKAHAAFALKQFVVAYAKNVLPQKLLQNSLSVNLNYNQIQIRHAKTRWGSCSTQHKIMLNAALVLLPEALIDYVCIHELVHTQHFDHSPAFWNAVKKFDPNYMQHRYALKQFQWPNWWLASA